MFMVETGHDLGVDLVVGHAVDRGHVTPVPILDTLVPVLVLGVHGIPDHTADLTRGRGHETDITIGEEVEVLIGVHIADPGHIAGQRVWVKRHPPLLRLLLIRLQLQLSI